METFKSFLVLIICLVSLQLINTWVDGICRSVLGIKTERNLAFQVLVISICVSLLYYL